MNARSQRAGYEKISATLGRDVLGRIRERTTNVSAYLNEAAEERLYFEHLLEMQEQLEKEGFDGSGGMPRLRAIAERFEKKKSAKRRPVRSAR